MSNPPSKEAVVGPNVDGVYFAMIRKSPYSLYLNVEEWFNKLEAKDILSHAQSESDGNVTISVFYRK